MGGDITVSSQVGTGTIFEIQLPLNESDAEAVRPTDQPRQVRALEPGQPTCRVMVADDVEDNRELLVQLLGPVGFDVRLANDGEQAIQQFEQWHPHLILMDFRMPVMDGHDAIRHIRALEGGKDIKIIAVTASALDENRLELLGIGADDFISKPFREAELFHKIHTHLGVQYVYAAESLPAVHEEQMPVTPTSLAKLPKSLIHLMRDAVLEADLDGLLAKIRLAETHDPDLARALQGLAERFEYERLLDLLGPAGDGELLPLVDTAS
jgi:CheY-like chemotaxis protein